MKKNEIIFTLVFTFIVVTAWIIFNYNRSNTAAKISETLSIQAIPIEPEFDTKIIEKLKKRIKIAPIYELQQNLPQRTSSPSATPLPDVTQPQEGQISTPSVELIPNPESTNSSEENVLP